MAREAREEAESGWGVEERWMCVEVLAEGWRVKWEWRVVKRVVRRAVKGEVMGRTGETSSIPPEYVG